MKNKKTLLQIFILVVVLAVITVFTPKVLKSLNFGLDLQGGFEVLYQVESIDGSEVTTDMVTSTYKTIIKRIDSLGVSEPNIVVEGDNHIRIQLAGVTDPDTARKMVSKAATLTFRDTSDNIVMTSDVLVSGGAKVGADQTGKPAVSLAVKDKEAFYKATKMISESEDQTLVIWLDYEDGVDSFSNTNNGAFCGKDASNCLSAATVPQGFSSDVIIQGNFEVEEVEQLVDLINSGSLPTKLTEISSKTVDATFGGDSLTKTFKAGVIGIALIIAFMIFVYRFAGVIASIGMLVYAFVNFFVFWLVGGVLTLPGIAALVVGIGMAIDSCVITFSRIRDELREGKSLTRAYKEGNRNSLSAIIDSNITTLIVAFILFMFGESSVKGYATMLIINTLMTMFIMVYVMRFLLSTFVETGWFDKHLNLFVGYKEKRYDRNLNLFKKIDFVKVRVVMYIFVALLFAGGIFSLCTNKLNLGIDFKGGSSISIAAVENINVDDVVTYVGDLGYNVYDNEVIDEKSVIIKINESLDQNQLVDLENKVSDEFNATTNIGVVSNVVKKELVKNAVISVALALLCIVIYVSLRFKFSYAISGIVALVHDVFMMFAFFSIFKLEVSSIFIAAILSIIGYSINDTIVTFDRIRENVNAKKKFKNKDELKEIVNRSLYETMGRSIITTMTTLFPVVSLIIISAHEIINFNIALLVGLVVGVFSSLFISSQMWYDIEKGSIGKPIKKKWYEEDNTPEEKRIKGINI